MLVYLQLLMIKAIEFYPLKKVKKLRISVLINTLSLRLVKTRFLLFAVVPVMQNCVFSKKAKMRWVFWKKDADGKIIGIVSSSRCPQPDDKSFDLRKFLQRFNERVGKWNSVILDVRGNEGGNSYALLVKYLVDCTAAMWCFTSRSR